jgi:long-chain acyl-CoA synthetase
LPGLGEEVGSDVPLPEVPYRNIGQMVAARAAADPSRPAVRSRGASGKWVDLTWGRLDERRRAIAAGLASLGVKRGDVVAVVAPNSPEMLVAELAVLSLGAASAPIFPESTPDLLLYCLTDSGARVAFVGSAVQQRRTLPARGLERVIVLDDQPLPDDARGLPLKALETMSAGSTASVERDDVAFVLYTGGTTGRPKGVELTHWNVLSQQAAISAAWELSERDVFLATLPWNHVFGALFERFMALWQRALLVLDDSRGRDLEKLISNWAEIKPTVYFGVPRVYSALAARGGRDAKAKTAVLHKSLRFVFSAAAPLSASVVRYFEESGVLVLEGWGLTETAPVVTLTAPGKPRAPGTVGWPLPGTTVKLQPVPDVHFGEVLVRGAQVMRGYHQRDSSEALRGGWLHTGDLAEWTQHGLRLHGRVDGVFKLENGEKVSSGEIEARILAATPLLEQAVVLGEGRPFVAALCWIAQGPARRFLAARDEEVPATLPELARVPELRRAIVEVLQAANLLVPARYERVERVALVTEAPALETGELTPTLRLVRAVSEQRHADLIDALRADKPHPLVLEIERRRDPLHRA